MAISRKSLAPEPAPDLDALKAKAQDGDEKSVIEIKKYLREKKVRALIENSDPMGITTGAHAARPKTFPTQPTPERVERGKEREEVLDRRPLLSDRGEALNEHITEIAPQLRALYRRRTISSQEYAAALQLCKDWHGARFRGAATVKYEMRVDGGGRGHYESDHVIACRQRVNNVLARIGDRDLAEGIAWIIGSMGDGEPLYVLGKRHLLPGEDCPSDAVLSVRGAVLLRNALRFLCRCYGIRLHEQEPTPQAREIVNTNKAANM
jgi:hypothetical protein